MNFEKRKQKLIDKRRDQKLIVEEGEVVYFKVVSCIVVVELREIVFGSKFL